MHIHESLFTKVADSYDVAVCGGGFAGISAALAAARQGKKTVLFEKLFMLGGLGTAGLVTIYLPLCDGVGHQVSYGIAEELFHLSIRHGAEALRPENWLGSGSRTEKDPRFEVQYNPQMFAILAEKLLLDAGVEILYGTGIVAVAQAEGKITHLITESKSGRLAYKVGSVVDATGDCDVAYMAGVPTEKFGQGNVLAAWYYSLDQAGYRLNMLGFCDVPEEEKNGQERVEKLVNRRFVGVDGKELSDMMCLSHQSTYQDFLRRHPDEPTAFPVTIATTPQVRMTRRIAGEYTLSNTEEHTYFADSIGMVSNWKRRGSVYEVPFGTLYNSQVKNLLCAGRCVSVTEPMWDVMRVIPCCAVTGQAAGTAAAMTDDMTRLDVKQLQTQLQKAGVRLHESEIF